MSISLQNLDLFRQLAEMKNYTAVSEKNYLTQSALSRMILSMEKELGFRLFDRTTRHASLTEEGSLFYSYACRTLKEYEQTLQDISRLKKNAFLKIGYNPVSGPPRYLLQALDRLRERVPALSIEMIRAYSRELFRMLDESTIDCALVSTFYMHEPEHYETLPMQPINTYALMRHDSALNRPGMLGTDELDGQEIVFMADTAPLTRSYFYSYFASSARSLREGQPAENLEDMIFRIRLNGSIGISSFSNSSGQYADIAARLLYPKTDLNGGKCRALVWKKGQEKQPLELLCGILTSQRQTPPEDPYPYLP